MWNLDKNDTNKLFTKQKQTQIYRMNLGLPAGRVGEG